VLVFYYGSHFYGAFFLGQGLSFLQKIDVAFAKKVLPSVRIFARVSPKQKEQVILQDDFMLFAILISGCSSFFIRRPHKLLYNSSRTGRLA